MSSPAPTPNTGAPVASATPASTDVTMTDVSTNAPTTATPAESSSAANTAPATTPTATASTSSPLPTGASTAGPLIVSMPLPPRPTNVRYEGDHVVGLFDKPFVYGSAAFWQGKNIPASEHSHKWTVYLRGLENEDLSYFIKSVAFTLHHSFEEPTRVLYAAPYEVTETGWGEFPIGITVTFNDISGLDPVQFSHPLKLFPPPGIQPTTKRPVISEVYDEFVFVNPSKEWFEMLHSGPTKKVDQHPLTPYFITGEFAKDEDTAIAKLQAANETIQLQIDQQRAKLFQVDQEIEALTSNLHK